MTEAIEQARFVLLGESHFSRETPQLAAAICRAMHPDAYAVEAGPYAAAYVQAILKSPDRQAVMQQRERTRPANMAFLNNEQENNLAASCVASGKEKQPPCGGSTRSFWGGFGAFAADASAA